MTVEGIAALRDTFLRRIDAHEDTGNKSHSTPTIPKVIGAINGVSGDVGQRLYDAAVAKTVRVSPARVAEATS